MPSDQSDPVAVLREFFDSYANEINYSDELTAALAEIARRREVEARLERWLKDGCAVLLRLWDETEGWSVKLHDPDTSDGEPPMPDGSDTTDWSHNPDYHAALAHELDRAGAEP